jgi:hypothetical protein
MVVRVPSVPRAPLVRSPLMAVQEPAELVERKSRWEPK